MQRIMTSAALVFASALLLSGCAAGGGGATATADPCEAVRSEVRDVSNGAQNALAAGGDPADVQATIEGYSERVTTLGETTTDEVSTALEGLSGALDDAAEFAATLPSDPEAEVDADALAEHQTAIQDAATEASSACTSDTEETEG
jgi:hypothetical protein